MAKSVAVLSDGHLGDANSVLGRPAVQAAVAQAIADRGTDTLVLLGDALDLDLGLLATAVEGDPVGNPRRLGLRALLKTIYSKHDLARVVYVAGNHDFMVFDWEGARRNALQPLADGKRLTGRPLQIADWNDHFLRGVMPAGRQDRFRLVYPDYAMKVGGRKVLFFHGHYLDPKQVEGVSLTAAFACRTEPERRKFIYRVFTTCAQWQHIAHAVAICSGTREGVATGYHRLTSAWDKVCNVFGAITGSREKGPSPQDLRAIEAYLLYMPYVTKQPIPDAFVYGHTHVPGGWTVGGKSSGLPEVAVYNPGSFVPPTGTRASMLFLNPETGGMKTEFVYFRR